MNQSMGTNAYTFNQTVDMHVTVGKKPKPKNQNLIPKT